MILSHPYSVLYNTTTGLTYDYLMFVLSTIWCHYWPLLVILFYPCSVLYNVTTGPYRWFSPICARYYIMSQLALSDDSLMFLLGTIWCHYWTLPMILSYPCSVLYNVATGPYWWSLMFLLGTIWCHYWPTLMILSYPCLVLYNVATGP